MGVRRYVDSLELWLLPSDKRTVSRYRIPSRRFHLPRCQIFETNQLMNLVSYGAVVMKTFILDWIVDRFEFLETF